MNNLLSKLLKFLGLLVLIVLVSLVPELIGGDIAAALKEGLGDNYYLAIGGLGLVAILIYTLWTEGDRIFKKRKDTPGAEAVSRKNLEEIRAGLMDSYRERLQSKLAARFPVNLTIAYSTEGSPTKATIYDNHDIPHTEIRQELISVFDHHRGRLLMIGAPGSGKTTLLLQLAHQLLQRQDGAIVDIPIIINIATWRERFSSVEDWLLELLPQMGFSKALAQQLLREKTLLPFFDGLDELAAEQRPACLEAIAKFGRDAARQYVISSRIAEYTATIDAPVYCQIMVQPLTLDQIRTGLQQAYAPETNGLLNAMDRDPLLAEAIKTPFYLNTVQLLFASMRSWQEFGFKSNTVKGRKKEIVAFFVADATGSFEKYSSDQVKKWLGFLADRMEWKGLVNFELANLQYDWIHLAKTHRIIAELVASLVSGLFFSLILTLVFGLAFSIVGLAYFGFILGLFLGVFLGSVTAFINAIPHITLNKMKIEIETTDIIIGSFSMLKRTFVSNILLLGIPVGILYGFVFNLIIKQVGELLGGILSGLFGGIFFGLLLILYAAFSEIKTERMKISLSIFIEVAKKYLAPFQFLGSFLGLSFGLIFGTIFFLFDDLVFGINESLILGLVIGLIGVLIEQLSHTESYLKVSKPYQRFLGSLWSFHFSILQHFHLRYLLIRNDVLPKKLVRFLNGMASKFLMESDGGSWRFRHRILQEYFAGHWAAEYSAKHPRVESTEELKSETEDRS